MRQQYFRNEGCAGSQNRHSVERMRRREDFTGWNRCPGCSSGDGFFCTQGMVHMMATALWAAGSGAAAGGVCDIAVGAALIALGVSSGPETAPIILVLESFVPQICAAILMLVAANTIDSAAVDSLATTLCALLD